MPNIKALHAFMTRFPNEGACLGYLIQARWGGRPTCPRCNGQRGTLIVSRRLWACSATRCGGHLSVLKGTAFGGTKKSLVSWFEAVWWFHQSNGTLTAADLQVLVGIRTHRTASAWLSKLRHLAMELFVDAAEACHEQAAILLPLLNPTSMKKKLGSCLSMILELLESIQSLRPTRQKGDRSWSGKIRAWGNNLGNRRAPARSFPIRACELGFHLAAKTYYSISDFLGVLSCGPSGRTFGEGRVGGGH